MLPSTSALLGITPPEGKAREMEGADLWKIAVDETDARPYITSGFKDYAAYRDNEQLFICHFSGGDRRLYFAESDPELANNVADEHTEVTDSLFDKILDDAGGELPQYEDPRSSEEGEWYQPSPWYREES
jgi:hypothetical protein